MKKSMITIGSLCAVLACPALAQDSRQQQQQQQQRGEQERMRRSDQRAAQQDDQQRRRSGQQGQRRQQQRSRQVSDACVACCDGMKEQGEQARFELKGKLEGLRVATHEGERHLIARMQSENGRTFLVDLGSIEGLRASGVGLRGDEPIQVSGRTRSTRARVPMIVVERFRVKEGPMVIVAVPRAEGGSGQVSQQDPRQRTTAVIVQGTITQTRDFQVEGLPDRHRLLKLKTNEGRTIVVDIGAARQLEQDVRLNQGELVTVVGRLGRINGRPVLFASHISDLATIDWSNQRPADGEAQQRRREQEQEASQDGQRQGQRGRRSGETGGY